MLERCYKNSNQCWNNVRECQLNSYFGFKTYVVTEVQPWDNHSITSPFCSTKVSLLPPRSLKRGKNKKRRAGNQGKEKEQLPPSSALSLY